MLAIEDAEINPYWILIMPQEWHGQAKFRGRGCFFSVCPEFTVAAVSGIGNRGESEGNMFVNAVDHIEILCATHDFPIAALSDDVRKYPNVCRTVLYPVLGCVIPAGLNPLDTLLRAAVVALLTISRDPDL
jgi:hypothetical protein